MLSADKKRRKPVYRCLGSAPRLKLEQIDYDALKNSILEKKFSTQEAVLRVEQLEHTAKQRKEMDFIKQHSIVWKKEAKRLERTRDKLEEELALQRDENAVLADTDEIFKDLNDEWKRHHYAREEFHQHTVTPVLNLREDLVYRLEEYRLSKQSTTIDNWEDILDVILSVKDQQTQMLEKMKYEIQLLETQLCDEAIKSAVEPPDRRVMEGIPQEAIELFCPYEDLRESVLQEFIVVDVQYKDKLHQLKQRHLPALGNPPGEWSQEERDIFQYVADQYPFDQHNRRTLMIDRLKRQLPRRTRTQIVEYETWLEVSHYFQERRTALINDWANTKQALYRKAVLVFGEATEASERKREDQRRANEQRSIATQLMEKVQRWRKQKFEALQMEMELHEMKRIAREDLLAAERRAQEEKKAQVKKQIGEFKETIVRRKEMAEERHRQALEALKKELESQADQDWERIHHREELAEKKLAEKRDKELLKEEEEREREKKLESLREQVRPHVEFDPVRLHGHTQATYAKLGIGTEPEIDIHKPLFSVHGYTESHIGKDQRVRLEAKLRDAGLLNTDYARHILTQIKPPTKPRPDLMSNVFPKEQQQS